MNKYCAIVIATLTVSLTANTLSAKTKAPSNPKITVLQATDVFSKVPDDSDYFKMASLAKTANLSAALKGIGPFTVFAPNNAAFRQLPVNQIDSLVADPAKLTSFLRGYIVKGKYGKAQIIAALTAGKGKMKLTTVDGKSLKLALNSASKLMLSDAAGNTAQLISFDMQGTNSVLNGINAVLMPVK